MELGPCDFCGVVRDALGFEKNNPREYHTLSRCNAHLQVQLRAERILTEHLEELVGLLEVAEHAQEYAEIDAARTKLNAAYAARAAAGYNPPKEGR